MQFLVRNPHSFVHVEAKDPKTDELVRWSIEWGAAGQLAQQGVDGIAESRRSGKGHRQSGAQPGRPSAAHGHDEPLEWVQGSGALTKLPRRQTGRSLGSKNALENSTIAGGRSGAFFGRAGVDARAGRPSSAPPAAKLPVAAEAAEGWRRRGRGGGGGGGRGGGGGGAPATPQAAAPIDLTGYWVSIVTEDWRYRMVTPAKGDYASVPDKSSRPQSPMRWDPAKDEAAGEQCKSYGAAAIMRVPGRLHITWENENDAEDRDRRGHADAALHFGGQPAATVRTGWQGCRRLMGGWRRAWRTWRRPAASRGGRGGARRRLCGPARDRSR